MKELPKVFVSNVNKDISNNATIYYDKMQTISKPTPSDINQKINKIFSSSKYVYKADVKITTVNGKINKKIIGRNKNELITMDNELIKISDIIDIEFSEN